MINSMGIEYYDVKTGDGGFFQVSNFHDLGYTGTRMIRMILQDAEVVEYGECLKEDEDVFECITVFRKKSQLFAIVAEARTIDEGCGDLPMVFYRFADSVLDFRDYRGHGYTAFDMRKKKEKARRNNH